MKVVTPGSNRMTFHSVSCYCRKVAGEPQKCALQNKASYWSSLMHLLSHFDIISKKSLCF